jgi:phosphoribosyl-AMP cyclohydrolase
MADHAAIERGAEFRFDYTKIRQIIEGLGDNNVVPVAVQDADTLEVLIIAYANEQALQHTLTTRKATFWSTSRNELWVKGDTSGDILEVQEIRVNCDQNSLLYLVRPRGKGACHVKQPDGLPYRSCYYRRIKLDSPRELEFVL